MRALYISILHLFVRVRNLFGEEGIRASPPCPIYPTTDRRANYFSRSNRAYTRKNRTSLGYRCLFKLLFNQRATRGSPLRFIGSCHFVKDPAYVRGNRSDTKTLLFIILIKADYNYADSICAR